MQIKLGGLDILVSKPERDHRCVYSGPQQTHRCGMPEHVHGHRFLGEGGTGIGSQLHVFGEPVFESITAECRA